MIEYRNLDGTKAFARLASKRPPSLKDLLAPDRAAKRIGECAIPAGAGLVYSYAAKAVDDDILDILGELADEQQLIAKYREILAGRVMNTGEKRMVLHHLLRGELAGPVIDEGANLRDFYAQQQERVAAFARCVHAGAVKGSTGRSFDTVVQIGIGGSDLGPRALCIALDTWARTEGAKRMKAAFISNVDPDDADAVLDGIDPETTLLILVSKSGTTQETLTNRDLVIRAMEARGIPGLVPKKHMICVTSATSPLAADREYLDSFFIDDYIGGRYSATSAVGGALLSLVYGPETFTALLAGAAESDRLSLEPDLRKNAALCDAMIGLYERNVAGHASTAILPYSQGLSRFPAHLQQLDMESNGKRVNRDGGAISYSTGPVIFGEPGTNGQHSFYQLLHQGTDIVPLQFIGFSSSQGRTDMDTDGSSSLAKLNANLAAQIVAFALGQDHADTNRLFPGERPSSLIHGKRLDPAGLGALLAHFENKVMFQGLAWNINSFDQEGVQLGKLLTGKLLGGDAAHPALDAYFSLLGQGKTS